MVWCLVKHKDYFTYTYKYLLLGKLIVYGTLRLITVFMRIGHWPYPEVHKRVYPKISGLAAWSEN
jgi:hypothetical protein